jgi:predicted aspartyl protease
MAGLAVGALAMRPAASENIQLERSGGVYTVPVRINDAITIPFVIDSGAAEVSIPADVFMTLSRAGTVSRSDFVGAGSYVLADGSRQSSERFIIHKVSVGGHIVTNVVANVAPVKGEPLLGQSFLSRP